MHTNIVGCTVFAAVSGSSAATLTTVGKMSIPELRKRNYPETHDHRHPDRRGNAGPDDPALADADRLWRHHQ